MLTVNNSKYCISAMKFTSKRVHCTSFVRDRDCHTCKPTHFHRINVTECKHYHMIDFPLQEVQAECSVNYFSFKFLWWKVFHMVIFTEAKSTLLIASIDCTSSTLRCRNVIQHWYNHLITCTSLHRHVDIQWVSHYLEEVLLQNIPVHLYYQKFQVKCSCIGNCSIW